MRIVCYDITFCHYLICRTFDADKEAQAMIKDGVFQSILPDGTVTTEPWE